MAACIVYRDGACTGARGGAGRASVTGGGMAASRSSQ
jgi:hypothetical protein